ncbi:hypothetical protein OEZ85_002869 [Tetradesmus obliquus]|uniref:Uncharacterized protein n=1 Tax=Tetradesmus obliquus TaxID=3088 RepID=A0ABY8TYW0_TETOB|nr:hypothetical protein OEZ85_002869 [Tetradesmus obliquus]
MWVQVNGRDSEKVATLQAIGSSLLGDYEQHIAAARSPGLASAVVQCLASCAASSSHTGGQQRVLQASLATLKAFSISSSGQQALIDAGAAQALCCILPLLTSSSAAKDLDNEDAAQQPAKRPRLAPSSSEVLAVQVLAALLLEAPTRPDLTALGKHARAAYQAMAQVACAMQQPGCSPELQKSAAAVLARLAMEPAVEWLLLHGAPTSSDVGSSTTGSLLPADSSSSPDALAMLLGGADAVAPFLTDELSVAGLFGELLAAGLHCPVMGVEETDAVQHLQEMHQAGQLLQPLQHNQDVRKP